MDSDRISQLLSQRDLQKLFIEELLWDLPRRRRFSVRVDNVPVVCHAVAEKGGIPVLYAVLPQPMLHSIQRDLRLVHRRLRVQAHEHLLVCTTAESVEMHCSYSFQWLGRDVVGQCALGRKHGHSTDLWILEQLSFDWDELDGEGRATTTAVRHRLIRAFSPSVVRDAQRFMQRASYYAGVLAEAITGVSPAQQRDWLARLLLLRLAVVVHLDRHRRLGSPPGYLKSAVTKCDAAGIPYYRAFLRPLLTECLGRAPEERPPCLREMLSIPVLDGGLFSVQPVEARYPNLDIETEALREVSDWLADDLRQHRGKLGGIDWRVLGGLFERFTRGVSESRDLTLPTQPHRLAASSSDDAAESFMRLARRTPLLSIEDEKAIASDALACADSKRRRAAQCQLVEANLRLVGAVARKYARRCPVPLEDLMQEGVLGLIKAAEKFEPHRETKLSTYATWWIRQGIVRYVDENSSLLHLPVFFAEQTKALSAARPRLACELKREPCLAESAEDVGVNIRFLRSCRTMLSLDTPLGASSLQQLAYQALGDDSGLPSDTEADTELQIQLQRLVDSAADDDDWDDAWCDASELAHHWEKIVPLPVPSPSGDHDDIEGITQLLDEPWGEEEPGLPTLLDLLCCHIVTDEPDPLDTVSNMVLREQLERVLGTLSERERGVLKMRFGLDGAELTLDEVGAAFGVTRERIRQIEAKALKKLTHPSRNKRLRDYFGEEPVHRNSKKQYWPDTIISNSRGTIIISGQGLGCSPRDFVVAVRELADRNRIFIGRIVEVDPTQTRATMVRGTMGKAEPFDFRAAFEAKFGKCVSWRNVNIVRLLEILGY